MTIAGVKLNSKVYVLQKTVVGETKPPVVHIKKKYVGKVTSVQGSEVDVSITSELKSGKHTLIFLTPTKNTTSCGRSDVDYIRLADEKGPKIGVLSYIKQKWDEHGVVEEIRFQV